MVYGHAWISIDIFSVFSLEALEHAAEFVAYCQDLGVAAFFWGYVYYFGFEVYVVPFELPDFAASCTCFFERLQECCHAWAAVDLSQIDKHLPDRI